jgi:hypothetical protein
MSAMATRNAPIRVTRDTDLDMLLDEAAKGSVILERDGELFRLERQDSIACEPDPEYVRATLDAVAGSWADLDVDKLIADIYEARRAGSRPPDRP